MKTSILSVGLALAVAALATLCPEANPQVKKANLPLKGSAQLKAPSVWSGSFQPAAGDPIPMVIYVVERNKRQFTATTWYPTLNTLISSSGEVDPEGNVTFTEDELIYRKAGIASAGAKYVGSTDGKVWNSDWEYLDGRKGKFQLKLAESTSPSARGSTSILMWSSVLLSAPTAISWQAAAAPTTTNRGR